ncbi:MAG: cache domain-containing protein, partial [Anaerolineae bacterium]
MNQFPLSSESKKTISSSPGVPLRVRLIVGNALILLIATTVLGYYIFNRLQASSAAQAEQLYQNILQQTHTNLEATTTIEANQLNDFFRTLRQNIVAIQKTTENLLSQEDVFSENLLWDARQNLSRLANGSWDNSNNETSAIYVPGKNELSDSLVLELNTLKRLDHFIPVLLQENPDTIAIYFGSVNGATIYYPNIDLAAVLPPDFDITQRPWFLAAAPQANPNRSAVWSVPYLDAAQNGLVITVSAPVYDHSKHFRGVIAMDIQLNRITTLISGIQVGKNGYALLLDSANRIIAMPPAAYADFGLTPEQVPLGAPFNLSQLTHVSPKFPRILAEMNAGKSGIATFLLRDANHFIAYHPIPEVNYSLAVIAPANELLTNAIAAREILQSQSQKIIIQSIALISIILLIALLATFGFSNSLIAPLSELTQSAQKIAAGEFVEVHTKARDELGTLANAFNTMTAALRDLIQSLEQRVAERTAQLENARLQSEKRAQRLEVISQVSRAISQESNLDNLLPYITQLVSERFNFYHAGIFLLDDDRQYAVLR